MDDEKDFAARLSRKLGISIERLDDAVQKWPFLGEEACWIGPREFNWGGKSKTVRLIFRYKFGEMHQGWRIKSICKNEVCVNPFDFELHYRNCKGAALPPPLPPAATNEPPAMVQECMDLIEERGLDPSGDLDVLCEDLEYYERWVVEVAAALLRRRGPPAN